jgi:Cu-Zn family superoxide dismutase
MKILVSLMIPFLLSGCSTMMSRSPQANVELRNAKGESIGSASFWEDANGVRIVANVRDVPPGRHGFHFHTVGKCDPPDFESAGGHFNPANKKHGLKSKEGPHAGDLPNIEVGTKGTGRFEYTSKLITLGGGPNSLFDSDGTALVLHANPDDEITDPTGNAGGRIACGVIRKMS